MCCLDDRGLVCGTYHYLAPRNESVHVLLVRIRVYLIRLLEGQASIERFSDEGSVTSFLADVSACRSLALLLLSSVKSGYA